MLTIQPGCKNYSTFAHKSMWYTILTNWKIKKNVINSIDGGKAFHKIQHTFMVKTLHKTGIGGKYLNSIIVLLLVTLDSLQTHGLRHTRLPWPSLSPGFCSNSRPSSQWHHPTISSSAIRKAIYNKPQQTLFLMVEIWKHFL